MTRVNTLTEIWNTYNENIINENAPGKPATKHGTKPGKPPVSANKVKKGFYNDKTSGPNNADNVQKVHDPKVETDNEDLQTYSSQNFDKKLEKKVKESINNYMKSTFDKLFENVMGSDEQQELEALGVDVDNDGDVDVDAGEEVTVTLGADHVKALKEILAQIEPEDGDDGDAEAEDMEHEDYEEMEETSSFEEDEEDGEDEDEDETHKEAVEATDEGHPLVNQKQGNPTPISSGSNTVKGTVTSKAKKGKGGQSKVNKQDDPDGTDIGHALVNQKDAGLTSTKNNKVGSLTVGADLFGDN